MEIDNSRLEQGQEFYSSKMISNALYNYGPAILKKYFKTNAPSMVQSERLTITPLTKDALQFMEMIVDKIFDDIPITEKEKCAPYWELWAAFFFVVAKYIADTNTALFVLKFTDPLLNKHNYMDLHYINPSYLIGLLAISSGKTLDDGFEDQDFDESWNKKNPYQPPHFKLEDPDPTKEYDIQTEFDSPTQFIKYILNKILLFHPLTESDRNLPDWQDAAPLLYIAARYICVNSVALAIQDYASTFLPSDFIQSILAIPPNHYKEMIEYLQDSNHIHDMAKMKREIMVSFATIIYDPKMVVPEEYLPLINELLQELELKEDIQQNIRTNLGHFFHCYDPNNIKKKYTNRDIVGFVLFFAKYQCGGHMEAIFPSNRQIIWIYNQLHPQTSISENYIFQRSRFMVQRYFQNFTDRENNTTLSSFAATLYDKMPIKLEKVISCYKKKVCNVVHNASNFEKKTKEECAKDQSNKALLNYLQSSKGKAKFAPEEIQFITNFYGLRNNINDLYQVYQSVLEVKKDCLNWIDDRMKLSIHLNFYNLFTKITHTIFLTHTKKYTDNFHAMTIIGTLPPPSVDANGYISDSKELERLLKQYLKEISEDLQQFTDHLICKILQATSPAKQKNAKNLIDSLIRAVKKITKKMIGSAPISAFSLGRQRDLWICHKIGSTWQYYGYLKKNLDDEFLNKMEIVVKESFEWIEDYEYALTTDIIFRTSFTSLFSSPLSSSTVPNVRFSKLLESILEKSIPYQFVEFRAMNQNYSDPKGDLERNLIVIEEEGDTFRFKTNEIQTFSPLPNVSSQKSKDDIINHGVALEKYFQKFPAESSYVFTSQFLSQFSQLLLQEKAVTIQLAGTEWEDLYGTIFGAILDAASYQYLQRSPQYFDSADSTTYNLYSAFSSMYREINSLFTEYTKLLTTAQKIRTELDQQHPHLTAQFTGLPLAYFSNWDQLGKFKKHNRNPKEPANNTRGHTQSNTPLFHNARYLFAARAESIKFHLINLRSILSKLPELTAMVTPSIKDTMMKLETLLATHKDRLIPEALFTDLTNQANTCYEAITNVLQKNPANAKNYAKVKLYLTDGLRQKKLAPTLNDAKPLDTAVQMESKADNLIGVHFQMYKFFKNLNEHKKNIYPRLEKDMVYRWAASFEQLFDIPDTKFQLKKEKLTEKKWEGYCNRIGTIDPENTPLTAFSSSHYSELINTYDPKTRPLKHKIEFLDYLDPALSVQENLALLQGLTGHLHVTESKKNAPSSSHLHNATLSPEGIQKIFELLSSKTFAIKVQEKELNSRLKKIQDLYEKKILTDAHFQSKDDLSTLESALTDLSENESINSKIRELITPLLEASPSGHTYLRLLANRILRNKSLLKTGTVEIIESSMRLMQEPEDRTYYWGYWQKLDNTFELKKVFVLSEIALSVNLTSLQNAANQSFLEAYFKNNYTDLWRLFTDRQKSFASPTNLDKIKIDKIKKQFESHLKDIKNISMNTTPIDSLITWPKTKSLKLKNDIVVCKSYLTDFQKNIQSKFKMTEIFSDYLISELGYQSIIPLSDKSIPKIPDISSIQDEFKNLKAGISTQLHSFSVETQTEINSAISNFQKEITDLVRDLSDHTSEYYFKIKEHILEKECSKQYNDIIKNLPEFMNQQLEEMKIAGTFDRSKITQTIADISTFVQKYIRGTHEESDYSVAVVQEIKPSKSELWKNLQYFLQIHPPSEDTKYRKNIQIQNDVVIACVTKHGTTFAPFIYHYNHLRNEIQRIQAVQTQLGVSNPIELKIDSSSKIDLYDLIKTQKSDINILTQIYQSFNLSKKIYGKNAVSLEKFLYSDTYGFGKEITMPVWRSIEEKFSKSLNDNIKYIETGFRDRYFNASPLSNLSLKLDTQGTLFLLQPFDYRGITSYVSFPYTARKGHDLGVVNPITTKDKFPYAKEHYQMDLKANSMIQQKVDRADRIAKLRNQTQALQSKYTRRYGPLGLKYRVYNQNISQKEALARAQAAKIAAKEVIKINRSPLSTPTRNEIRIENLSSIYAKKGSKYAANISTWFRGLFKSYLSHKIQIEPLGLREIPPAYTSQKCPECQELGEKGHIIYFKDLHTTKPLFRYANIDQFTALIGTSQPPNDWFDFNLDSFDFSQVDILFPKNAKFNFNKYKLIQIQNDPAFKSKSEGYFWYSFNGGHLFRCVNDLCIKGPIHSKVSQFTGRDIVGAFNIYSYSPFKYRYSRLKIAWDRILSATKLSTSSWNDLFNCIRSDPSYQFQDIWDQRVKYPKQSGVRLQNHLYAAIKDLLSTTPFIDDQYPVKIQNIKQSEDKLIDFELLERQPDDVLKFWTIIGFTAGWFAHQKNLNTTAIKFIQKIQDPRYQPYLKIHQLFTLDPNASMELKELQQAIENIFKLIADPLPTPISETTIVNTLQDWDRNLGDRFKQHSILDDMNHPNREIFVGIREAILSSDKIKLKIPQITSDNIYPFVQKSLAYLKIPEATLSTGFDAIWKALGFPNNKNVFMLLESDIKAEDDSINNNDDDFDDNFKESNVFLAKRDDDKSLENRPSRPIKPEGMPDGSINTSIGVRWRNTIELFERVVLELAQKYSNFPTNQTLREGFKILDEFIFRFYGFSCSIKYICVEILDHILSSIQYDLPIEEICKIMDCSFEKYQSLHVELNKACTYISSKSASNNNISIILSPLIISTNGREYIWGPKRDLEFWELWQKGVPLKEILSRPRITMPDLSNLKPYVLPDSDIKIVSDLENSKEIDSDESDSENESESEIESDFYKRTFIKQQFFEFIKKFQVFPEVIERGYKILNEFSKYGLKIFNKFDSDNRPAYISSIIFYHLSQTYDIGTEISLNDIAKRLLAFISPKKEFLERDINNTSHLITQLYTKKRPRIRQIDKSIRFPALLKKNTNENSKDLLTESPIENSRQADNISKFDDTIESVFSSDPKKSDSDLKEIDSDQADYKYRLDDTIESVLSSEPKKFLQFMENFAGYPEVIKHGQHIALKFHPNINSCYIYSTILYYLSQTYDIGIEISLDDIVIRAIKFLTPRSPQEKFSKQYIIITPNLIAQFYNRFLPILTKIDARLSDSILLKKKAIRPLEKSTSYPALQSPLLEIPEDSSDFSNDSPRPNQAPYTDIDILLSNAYIEQIVEEYTTMIKTYDQTSSSGTHLLFTSKEIQRGEKIIRKIFRERNEDPPLLAAVVLYHISCQSGVGLSLTDVALKFDIDPLVLQMLYNQIIQKIEFSDEDFHNPSKDLKKGLKMPYFHKPITKKFYMITTASEEPNEYSSKSLNIAPIASFDQFFDITAYLKECLKSEFLTISTTFPQIRPKNFKLISRLMEQMSLTSYDLPLTMAALLYYTHIYFCTTSVSFQKIATAIGYSTEDIIQEFNRLAPELIAIHNSIRFMDAKNDYGRLTSKSQMYPILEPQDTPLTIFDRYCDYLNYLTPNEMVRGKDILQEMFSNSSIPPNYLAAGIIYYLITGLGFTNFFEMVSILHLDKNAFVTYLAEIAAVRKKFITQTLPYTKKEENSDDI